MFMQLTRTIGRIYQHLETSCLKVPTTPSATTSSVPLSNDEKFTLLCPYKADGFRNIMQILNSSRLKQRMMRELPYPGGCYEYSLPNSFVTTTLTMFLQLNDRQSQAFRLQHVYQLPRFELFHNHFLYWFKWVMYTFLNKIQRNNVSKGVALISQMLFIQRHLYQYCFPSRSFIMCQCCQWRIPVDYMYNETICSSCQTARIGYKPNKIQENARLVIPQKIQTPYHSASARVVIY
jgi:hypothetical protein